MEIDASALHQATDTLLSDAVVFESPGKLCVKSIPLIAPGDSDLVVEIQISGISTGTERLLWEGEMPPFPGMGYPLVPGYEALGTVQHAGGNSGWARGDRVFVPGAVCHRDIHSLFGGACSRVVVPAERAFPINDSLGDNAILLALAATAHHALHIEPGKPSQPELIIGHGVVGRLLARLCVALGFNAPTVWETNPSRRRGTHDYSVVDPAQDDRKNYRSIIDVSGDSNILDVAIERLPFRSQSSHCPKITLAGFYKKPLSFSFAPAFMREASIQIAAEWRPQDLQSVHALVVDGKLSLEELITHTESPSRAGSAYHTAFNDAECLKMTLDWRNQ